MAAPISNPFSCEYPSTGNGKKLRLRNHTLSYSPSREEEGVVVTLSCCAFAPIANKSDKAVIWRFLRIGCKCNEFCLGTPITLVLMVSLVSF